MSVVLITSGPGTMNILSGIMSSYLESIPLIVITTKINNTNGYLYKPKDISDICNKFLISYKISSYKDLYESCLDIFCKLRNNQIKKMPICIEFEENILNKHILNYKLLYTLYKLKTIKNNLDFALFRINKYIGLSSNMNKFIKLFLKYKKPVLLIGNGVVRNSAFKLINILSNKYSIPIVHTALSIGSIDYDSKYNFGLLGINGSKLSYNIVNNSDLLIIIGSRCLPRTIGPLDKFAKKSYIIRVDIDEYELQFNIKANLSICCDSYDFCNLWLKYDIKNYSNDYNFSINKKINNIKKSINSVNINNLFNKINKYIKEKNPIITTGVGQCMLFCFKYIKLNNPNHFIISGTLASMGFGLPAAIGACIASNNKQIIVIDGDGSFQMSFQELAVVKQYKLNIIVIILNNSSLSLIKENANRISNINNDSYVNLKYGNPNFSKIAEAYGIKSIRINNDLELDKYFNNIIVNNTSYLIDIKIKNNYITVGNHVNYVDLRNKKYEKYVKK